MKVPLFLALSALFSITLAQELPAPEILSSQITKVTKIIASDTSSCSNEANALQQEINTRRLKVARFEQQIKVVRQRFELSRSSLQRELKAVSEVETLVRSVSSGAVVSNTTISKVNTTISEIQSGRMSGVLRNVFLSVSSASSPSSIDLDIAEVLKLLGDLKANIENTLKVESTTQEEKTVSEQLSVENASITDLQEKLAKAQGECDRRRSDYTEILSVLKLVEQKYANTTLPNCQPVVDAKDKLLQQCVTDKESVTKTLTETQTKLNEVTKTNDKCQSDLKTQSSSSSTTTTSSSSSSSSTTDAQCQADKKELTTQVEVLQKQVASLVTKNTVTESKLIETTQQLTKVTELAKCEEQKSQITSLERRLSELSIKVELGEKCAANYKAQSIEKTELLKQLEKMAILSKQLDQCTLDIAKKTRECQDAVQESTKAQTKIVEQLNIEQTRLREEISKLTEAAKCTSEKSVIEKYEKEVVTIKTETRTVVTQVEADARGCKAELESIKSILTKDETSLSECVTKSSTLEQQIKILQTSHASCVDSQSKTQSDCKAVATDLAQCQTDLRVQGQNITNSITIVRKLQEDKESLAVEVHRLEVEEKTLQKEVTTLTTKITEQESKIVTLKNDIAQKDKEYKLLAEQKSQYEQTIKTKLETITTVEKKIETLEISLKGEAAGNDKLMEELQKLHGEREALLKAKVEAEAQVAKIKIELGNLADFKAGAIKHLEDARDVITASDKKIEELTSRVSSAASRRATLTHRLDTCDAQLESTDKAVKTLRKELSQCQSKVSEQDMKLRTAEEAAKCLGHKATISELKKSGVALRVELRAAQAVKNQLVRQVSSTEAKSQAWNDLANKLQNELRDCAEDKAGCRSSVRSLKNQMLSSLRKIKDNVSSVSSLEVRLAAAQTELAHTRKQWASDRTVYKNFKDNLLNQMAKLIGLAKDAKHKFDVGRAASKNEFKVQDAQWGVARKEVLNYERILGSGVVKAEKEKLKAFLATRRYVAVKSSAESALRAAQKRTGSSQEKRDQQRARVNTNSRLNKLEKKAAKKVFGSAKKVFASAKKPAATARPVVVPSGDKKTSVKPAPASAKPAAKPAVASAAATASKAPATAAPTKAPATKAPTKAPATNAPSTPTKKKSVTNVKAAAKEALAKKLQEQQAMQ